jgi:hypothetical protein
MDYYNPLLIKFVIMVHTCDIRKGINTFVNMAGT